MYHVLEVGLFSETDIYCCRLKHAQPSAELVLCSWDVLIRYSIHQLPITANPLEADTGREAQYTLDRSLANHRSYLL